MATQSIAWGPIAFSQGTSSTPPVTIQPTSNALSVTADFSSMPAGVNRTLLAECRQSSVSPWQTVAQVTGTTVGGPDLNQRGVVIEWGFLNAPLPFPGVAGRQVRATLTLGQAATLSGHVSTS